MTHGNALAVRALAVRAEVQARGDMDAYAYLVGALAVSAPEALAAALDQLERSLDDRARQA